jgi:hypothetical protein
MDNHLTATDIENLLAGAGDHQGHIAVPREVFDILIQDVRRWPARDTLGFPYNLAASVKKV